MAKKSCKKRKRSGTDQMSAAAETSANDDGLGRGRKEVDPVVLAMVKPEDWPRVEGPPVMMDRILLAALKLQDNSVSTRVALVTYRRLTGIIGNTLGPTDHRDDAAAEKEAKEVVQIVDLILCCGDNPGKVKEEEEEAIRYDYKDAFEALADAMDAVREDRKLRKISCRSELKKLGKKELNRFRKAFSVTAKVFRHPDISDKDMIRVDVDDSPVFRKMLSNDYQSMISTRLSKDMMLTKGGMHINTPLKEEANHFLGSNRFVTRAFKKMIAFIMSEYSDRIPSKLMVDPDSTNFAKISHLMTMTEAEYDRKQMLRRQDVHADYQHRHLDHFDKKVRATLGNFGLTKEEIAHLNGKIFRPWSFDLPLGAANGMQLSVFQTLTKEEDDKPPRKVKKGKEYLQERRVHVPRGSFLLWAGNMEHAGAYPGIDNDDDPAFRAHGYLSLYKEMDAFAETAGGSDVVDTTGKFGSSMSYLAVDEAGSEWVNEDEVATTVRVYI